MGKITLAIKLIIGLAISFIMLILLVLFSNKIGLLFIFILIKYYVIIFYIIIFYSVFSGFYWSSKQKNKKIFKKKLYLIFISWAAIVFILACIFSTNYANCDKYTKELKGGIREFGDKKYTIKLCGARAFNNSENIRMEVFNDEGITLALRYFTVNANFVDPKELEYGAYKIIYYDYSKEDSLSILYMPPNRVDWIRAKLPFFN